MKYKINQLFLLLILLFSTHVHAEQIISLGEGNSILTLAELGTETFAAGSSNGTIRIFRHAPIKGYTCWHELIGHSGAVCLMLNLDNNTFASSSEDSTIRIWENIPYSYSCKAILTGHTAAAFDVVAVSNDILISRSYDKTLKMWEKDLAGDYTCKVTLDDIPDINNILSTTKLDDNRISLDCGDRGTRVYIVGDYSDTITNYLDGVIDSLRYSSVRSIHDPEKFPEYYSLRTKTAFVGSSRYSGCDGYDVEIHDNEIHIKEVYAEHAVIN